MTLDAGAAPAIDARKILFERRRFAISPAHHAVESAEAAFSAGAIVGGYDHQRVVEFARPAQRFQNASELMVGLAELGCEHLHLAGVESTLVRGKRRPCGTALGPRGQLCIGRNDANLLLSCETRSDEPTSDLQSLMRTSYAVFSF